MGDPVVAQGWPEPWFHADPSDPPEVRASFGYERLVITRRARQWYGAMGLTGLELEGACDDAYTRWARSLPTYREICERREERMRAKVQREWADGTGQRRLGLTRPELEFLADHFEGANDPTAQAILAKVRAIL